MTPLWLLVFGVVVLLGCGFPVLRISRFQAAQRRHLDARLETLRLPEEQIAAIGLPTGRGAVNTMKLPHSLRVSLARAGITLQWRGVTLVAIGVAAADVVLTLTMGSGRAIVICVAITFLGYIAFKFVSNRRLAAFVDSLPLYLDATRQLLLVGNSLQQAMVKAGVSASPPVTRHIGPLLRRIDFGAPPGDSIQWLAERLEVMELHMLAAAVQTNTRYGGRISTVLGNLTQILRDRARMGRELKSATAETRISGMVLAALPICVGGLVSIINPSYVRFFIDTHKGHTLIFTAMGLEILGVLVMRRLMRLDF
jgi:tight adherence protein B